MNVSSQTTLSSYDPKKENIGQLLSLTNPSLVVPDWQRNYSWKLEHVEVFWNDLQFFFERPSSVGTEYFLGSVVIVKSSDDNLRVLDGQQRLATAAILLSVIRDEVQGYKPEAAKQFQDSYLVGFDHVNELTIHKIRLNLYDREFFKRLVLQSRDGDYSEPEAEIASHHLIKQARAYFESSMSDLLKGLEPKEGFEKAMALSRCLLNQMTVIAVYSSDEDSAAEIFETLNDRGIGLSTPDLLRNLVIRRANEADQQQVVELWTDVISFEKDTAIKNFLRHFWVSRYGDVKSQSLYREIKRVVDENNIDSVTLSTSLSDSAKLYQKLLEANTSSASMNEVLEEVLEFGASSRILLPSLLGVNEVLGDEDAVKCAKALLNLFVRYAVILGRENSLLENVLYSATRKLRENSDAEAFLGALADASPSDGEVEDAFKRLSLSHNGTRRAILKRIELDLRGTEELNIANPSRVHVEHIYPQTPKADQRWENHARLVNRLGNLTLLSARLNKSIKNGSFNEKKTAFEASEIEMTKAVAKGIGWSPTLLESRQAAMATKVAKLWPVNVP